jgi:hypothetical protein
MDQQPSKEFMATNPYKKMQSHMKLHEKQDFETNQDNSTYRPGVFLVKPRRRNLTADGTIMPVPMPRDLEARERQEAARNCMRAGEQKKGSPKQTGPKK